MIKYYMVSYHNISHPIVDVALASIKYEIITILRQTASINIIYDYEKDQTTKMPHI